MVKDGEHQRRRIYVDAGMNGLRTMFVNNGDKTIPNCVLPAGLQDTLHTERGRDRQRRDGERGRKRHGQRKPEKVRSWQRSDRVRV